VIGAHLATQARATGALADHPEPALAGGHAGREILAQNRRRFGKAWRKAWSPPLFRHFRSSRKHASPTSASAWAPAARSVTRAARARRKSRFRKLQKKAPEALKSLNAILKSAPGTGRPPPVFGERLCGRGHADRVGSAWSALGRRGALRPPRSASAVTFSRAPGRGRRAYLRHRRLPQIRPGPVAIESYGRRRSGVRECTVGRSRPRTRERPLARTPRSSAPPAISESVIGREKK